MLSKKTAPIQVMNADVPPEIKEILDMFPELTATTEKLPKSKRQFMHDNRVEDEPIIDRSRRICYEKQKELDAMLEKSEKEVILKENCQRLSLYKKNRSSSTNARERGFKN